MIAGGVGTPESGIPTTQTELGIGEDPRHLAARIEEYQVHTGEKDPAVVNEIFRAIREKGRVYFEEVQREFPPAFERWILPTVLAYTYPDHRLDLIDGRLTAFFRETPKRLKIFPMTAAEWYVTRWPKMRKMKPFIIVRARLVKDRLKKRDRDQAKREVQCLDEPMP